MEGIMGQGTWRSVGQHKNGTMFFLLEVRKEKKDYGPRQLLRTIGPSSRQYQCQNGLGVVPWCQLPKLWEEMQRVIVMSVSMMGC